MKKGQWGFSNKYCKCMWGFDLRRKTSGGSSDHRYIAIFDYKLIRENTPLPPVAATFPLDENAAAFNRLNNFLPSQNFADMFTNLAHLNG